jgi:hypothetical protein
MACSRGSERKESSEINGTYASEIQHGHEQYDEKKILEDQDALLSLFLKLF